MIQIVVVDSSFILQPSSFHLTPLEPPQRQGERDGSIGDQDADAPAVVFSPTPPTPLTMYATAAQGPTSVSYTVVLSHEPSGTVSITVDPAPPGKQEMDAGVIGVTASPALLTFDANDWFIPQTVTLTAVPDATTALFGTRSFEIQHDVSGGVAEEVATVAPVMMPSEKGKKANPVLMAE